MKKPLALIILDGYGIGEKSPRNAIAAANTPFIDSIFTKYPSVRIKCSGLDVGLPDGQMGNSEVGHTNIGAGRVVYQELTRITKDIEEGTFFKNPDLLTAVDHAKEQGSTVHLMGLLSDGGVHSHINHLYALMKLCKDAEVPYLVHAFTDGRDVPPSSAISFVTALQDKIAEMGGGTLATVMGRFYVMDRDKRWERVDEAYNTLALGKGPVSEDFVKSIEASYAQGVTDEFLKPMQGVDYNGIHSEDSVIFFNFRPDRAREITAALTESECKLPSKTNTISPYYVCFTQYDESFQNVHIAFKPTALTNIFGEYISREGLTQLRIAETEKYAHVTFFFNGGEEKTFPGEERVLIPSPKVETYDLQPEMSAFEVADACCAEIAKDKFDVIILNFANCDMVGHTGMFDATVKAVEVVDKCCEQVYNAVTQAGGTCIFTADHGNADCMLCEDNTPFTAHSTNEVPLIICQDGILLKDEGRLCDIAPTMLKLLSLDKPWDMSGESLILD